MAPKEPETIEERMLQAEFEIQRMKEEFPNSNAAMCQDIEDVRSEGRETRNMVLNMQSEIALMPGKIVEAIENKGKGKRMELKEWLVVGLVVLGLIVSLPAAVQSLSKLVGP